MNKLDILHKIPAYFRNTPYLSKIAELISKSSVRFSALLVSQANQNYLLLKEGNVNVREDWQAFSLLRSSSSLLVSSGENLRKQPDVFRSRQGYGNQNIEDLNQALIGKNKQKVFIFTKTFTQEKVRSQINQQYYELLQIPHYQTVYNAIDMLIKQQNLPITLEVGTQILRQYFNQVDQGNKNQIDTLLISKFSGLNLQKYKGSKFDIPIEKHYNMKWRSDALNCKLSNGQQGILNFELYTSKQ